MAEMLSSYQEVVDFRPERFNPVVCAESDRTKVILACFEPGQFIPVHSPGVDLTLVVLNGEVIRNAARARFSPRALLASIARLSQRMYSLVYLLTSRNAPRRESNSVTAGQCLLWYARSIAYWMLSQSRSRAS